MRRLALLVALTLAAACGGGSGDVSADDPTALNALVASYDLAVDNPGRFLVGLVTNDQRLVSFGEADLAFSYLGRTRDEGDPRPGPTARARWQPIPGQDLAEIPDEPRIVDGSEGTGIYAADGVSFDRPGFWQLDVTAETADGTRTAQALFQVGERSLVVGPGDPAPRTVNALPGATDVPPKAIDSRAEPDGTVPDPELHAMTVAHAIASGKPTMVVVATPVYCVSRFCGPITDAVQKLAQQYGDRMNFVHLEVWRDFETTTVNKSAAEWIYPDGAEEATEPWVWVVDGDGIITHRFDNVASEDELATAVTEALDAAPASR